MSSQESDKNNVGGGVSSGGVGGVVSKATSFPMDLASKTLMKSNDSKGATVQAQPTFRFVFLIFFTFDVFGKKKNYFVKIKMNLF